MQFGPADWPFLPNEFECVQFGSSSKCQIGPFCATPSIWVARKVGTLGSINVSANESTTQVLPKG